MFDALADIEALVPVKKLYENGLPGMESEYQAYLSAKNELETCGISKDVLTRQKSELYTKLADVNKVIRQLRKQINLCDKLLEQAPLMKKEIQTIICPQKKHRHYRGYGD